MIRLLGVLLIALSSIFTGAVYINGIAEEKKRLSALHLLMKTIRARIACFSEPLNKIYEDFYDEALDTCGFLSVLKEKGLAFALKEKEASLFLPKEATEQLCGFASLLGKSFTEDQLKHCDYYLERFEDTLARLEEEYPRKRKLAKTLSLSLGLLAFLLLL